MVNKMEKIDLQYIETVFGKLESVEEIDNVIDVLKEHKENIMGNIEQQERMRLEHSN